MTTTLQSIPLAAFPLFGGLLVTSSLFFGNIGLSLVGPLPIIQDQIGASQLSNRSRLHVWRLFFDEASYYVVRGTALTVGLHASAPFFSQIPLARNLAIASALSSALVIVYTALMIQPTNKALKTLDAREVLTEAEEKDATGLIERWNRLHKVRYLMYGTSWATGLVALLTVLA